MNNMIAIKLKAIADESVHHGLFDGCLGDELVESISASISHMEDMSMIHQRFINNAKTHKAKIDFSRQKRADVEALLKKERCKNKRLANLLNVANHKCSAYKTILKDAISGANND